MSGRSISPEAKKAYWRANISLLTKLLAIWFVVSFGAGILFVDFLNTFTVLGFPVGFWFAQQGSIYVFVILIFVYAHKMKAIEQSFGMYVEGED
jgi:putative solute:sodium symporter small subunit